MTATTVPADDLVLELGHKFSGHDAEKLPASRKARLQQAVIRAMHGTDTVKADPRLARLRRVKLSGRDAKPTGKRDEVRHYMGRCSMQSTGPYESNLLLAFCYCVNQSCWYVKVIQPR